MSLLENTDLNDYHGLVGMSYHGHRHNRSLGLVGLRVVKILADALFPPLSSLLLRGAYCYSFPIPCHGTRLVVITADTVTLTRLYTPCMSLQPSVSLEPRVVSAHERGLYCCCSPIETSTPLS